MNCRELLRTLADLGAGLDPISPGRLILRWEGANRDALAAQLRPERETLAATVQDRALAEAWSGLPVDSLTPSLRVLLAWYALERNALPMEARQTWEAGTRQLQAEGWWPWMAEVVALEPHLPVWTPPRPAEAVA